MSSSKSILKSTSVIGGSSIITIVFKIISSKVIALILGPTGTGLIGTLQSSTSIIQTVSSLGINNSAVRDIAQANATNNAEKLSISIKSLKKAVLFTSLLGLGLTLFFSSWLSEFTFDSSEYTFEIRILSIAVFFNLIQGGQAALVQGMRRIKDLAKMSIFSSLVGVLIGLPILFLYELKGVAFFLVAISIGQYMISFYYAKKIEIVDVKVTWSQAYKETKAMVKLGFSFMGGALAGVLSTYLIRVIIIRDLSLADAGIYQAAFTLSGLYIGIILQAMGKDFYPRLTAIAFNSKKETQLINEQTQVGMILAAPGLMFTLALAPVVIRILYSNQYLEAFPILQWMILGVFLRTISWPMGYLFIARAKGKMFFFIQVGAQIILLTFTYFALGFFGLKGSGIAFFALYCIHIIYMYFLVKRENNFKWSNEVIKRMVLLSIAFLIAFIATLNLSSFWGSISSICIGLVLTIFALKEIGNILDVKSLKEVIDFIKKRK